MEDDWISFVLTQGLFAIANNDARIDHWAHLGGFVNFKAFVVKTLGRLHKDAVGILKKIADIAAVGTFMEPHKVLQRLQTKISWSLQRGNARLLAARYLALEV